MKQISPIKFFSLLKWLDGTPLPDVIEAYRQNIFNESLYHLDENGNPKFNLVLTGRAKKNWKSADLIFASLYRLLAWKSPLGNQCYILANDAGQAADDLEIAKKLIKVNPVLSNEVTIKKNIIERIDGEGFLEILPKDSAGAHGKTFIFCGFDEIHEYRSWDLLEALQLDPHRPDAMMWIASYASLYNYAGAPLHDLTEQGKKGNDPRMFFTWYSAEYCTDPDFAIKTPEAMANPSKLPEGYLTQQKKRLPSHRFRRLHLNIPGAPEGAYFSPELIEAAIQKGVSLRQYIKGIHCVAFVDMSGGSSDDATLSIGHSEGNRITLDGVWKQTQKPPFDPRQAIKLFAGILKSYGISRVTGDAYAGQTFRNDFLSHDISYHTCPVPKSSLYETLEVELNSGRVALLDDPKLLRQLLSLVIRGGKIDHPSGTHDDLANAAAGAVWVLKRDEPSDCEDEIELYDSSYEEEEAFLSRNDGEVFMSDMEDSPFDFEDF